jgi:hypothetical protein
VTLQDGEIRNDVLPVGAVWDADVVAMNDVARRMISPGA